MLASYLLTLQANVSQRELALKGQTKQETSLNLSRLVETRVFLKEGQQFVTIFMQH